MRILSFGSLNIDHVYSVPHFVRPGETIPSSGYSVFPGGKGANQSIALGRAGARVYHAGRIGPDGGWLRALLEDSGVDTSWLKSADEPTGHAIVQVNRSGENSIVLFGGANRAITRKDISAALGGFGPGDCLLCQNETSCVADMISLGAKQGLQVAFNPAPMDKAVPSYPLHKVACFIVNEVEGEELSGKRSPADIVAALNRKYPKAEVVLTLGKKGAMYSFRGRVLTVSGKKVKAVDTTAAGDTFIGYYLAQKSAGKDVQVCLETACAAAAVCVTRRGAASSIPKMAELCL